MSLAYPLDVRDSAAVERVGDRVLDDFGARRRRRRERRHQRQQPRRVDDRRGVARRSSTPTSPARSTSPPVPAARWSTSASAASSSISSLGADRRHRPGELLRQQGRPARALVDDRQGVRPRGITEQRRRRPASSTTDMTREGMSATQPGVLAPVLPARPPRRARRAREARRVPRVDGGGFINGQAIRVDGRLGLGAMRASASRSSACIPGASRSPMPALCAARGHDHATTSRDTMMIDERSVNPPWEDPVTMAVNAADGDAHRRGPRERRAADRRAARAASIRRSRSARGCSATSASTSRCRNFEVKHACYGGTGGLQLAAAFGRLGRSGRGATRARDHDRSEPHALRQAVGVRDGRGRVGGARLERAAHARARARQERRLHATRSRDLTRPTSRVETGQQRDEPARRTSTRSTTPSPRTSRRSARRSRTTTSRRTSTTCPSAG